MLAVSYPTATCLRNLTRLEYDADSLAGSPIVRQVKELYDELHDSVQAQAGRRAADRDWSFTRGGRANFPKALSGRS